MDLVKKNVGTDDVTMIARFCTNKLFRFDEELFFTILLGLVPNWENMTHQINSSKKLAKYLQ